MSTPTTPTARLPRQRVSPFDPPPDYRLLQESDPVSPLVFPGGGHRLAGDPVRRRARPARRPRFSSRRSFAMNPVRETPEEIRQFLEPEPGQFIGLDPPEHTRYRRLLTGQFTVRRMRALEPRITEIVEQQLQGMRRAGPPVRPGRVVRAAGALAGDLRAARRAVRATGRVPAALAAAADLRHRGPGAAARRREELRAYMLELVQAKRAAPADDLLSGLVATTARTASTTRS